MFVEVSPHGVAVREVDDLTRLHLQARDVDAQAVAAALRDSGSGELVDADTALLELDALRGRAEPASTLTDWPARWEAMIGYAGEKGWLSEDGRCVQVHIEDT
ncbi:MAG: hypothetical protein GEV09_12140 [Pseudonocardiaceae bacterium]|nr:hypothetical protein [Pseudonocardiaceae bacterium]